jgi:hypothetical protein
VATLRAVATIAASAVKGVQWARVARDSATRASGVSQGGGGTTTEKKKARRQVACKVTPALNLSSHLNSCGPKKMQATTKIIHLAKL